MKCPKCGSKNIYCLKKICVCKNCGFEGPKYEFSKVGATLGLFAGVKEWYEERKMKKKLEEEGKKKRSWLRISSLGIWLLLASLFVYWFPWLPLNVEIRFYIILGITIFSWIAADSNLTSLILSIFCIFLFFTWYINNSELIEKLKENQQLAPVINSISQIPANLRLFYCAYLDLNVRQQVGWSGDTYSYCYEQIFGPKGVKIGCVECVKFELQPRRVPARVHKPEEISVIISMSEGAQYPATNLIVSANSASKEGDLIPATIDKCTSSNPCTIYPGDEPITVKVRFEDVPCVPTFRYNVSVEYDYYIKSEISFDIKKELTRMQLMQIPAQSQTVSRSTSGPLSIGIDTDRSVYTIGIDDKIYVDFYPYNEGKGKVKIKQILIRQIPPADYPPLPLTGDYCYNQIEPEYLPNDMVKLTNFKYLLPSRGSDIVTCEYGIDKYMFEQLPPGSRLTYYFVGEANYTYILEEMNKGIVVDSQDYSVCKAEERV